MNMDSECRLRITPGKMAMALIDGTPADLPHFAHLLEVDADEIKVLMGTGTILRKRSESPLLRVSRKGDRLTVEGDNHALGSFAR
jgi:hypothetical protein